MAKTSKKYLRGDPAIPYEKDLKKASELASKLVRPGHEPLYFYKIRGDWNQAKTDKFMKSLSEENVILMKKLGVHLPQRFHFFKGFGLKMEKDSIQQTIDVAKLMHKHNLMVSVYIGGTIFTQYFYKERPEAKDWVRKTQGGEMCTYSSYQLGRYFPCLNNPEYIEYTYRVLDVAIDQVQADEIFFDNQILRNEPRSCRCNYCIEHLNKMIREKYTLDECEERYGFREYPDMLAPQWSQANKPWRLDRIGETLIQDWIDHRISMLKEFYTKMKNYVKSKSKTTAVGMNIKGIHGHNRGFNHGVDHGVVKDLFDWSCIDGYHPSFKDGVLNTELRFFKAAHSNHMNIESDFSTDLKCAEGQVFNYKKFIPGHGHLGDMGDCHLVSPTTYYFREIQNRLMDKKHVHDVAVLRTYPSVNYNCASVHEKLYPLEQTLIMHHIPFGIIFDENIEEIEKHRIIVLGEQEAISDKWLDALEKFMKKGGGVIATGKTASYNHWYRPRQPVHGLVRFLGHAPAGKYEEVAIGKGKFVYIPELKVHQKWSIEDWFSVDAGIKPVINEQEVLKAINDATGKTPLIYDIDGPQGLLPEAIWVSENKELDLHFVNYGAENMPLSVKVALPKGKTNAAVKLIVPDTGINESIDVSIGKISISVNLRSPKVYSCLQIKFS